MDILKAYTSLSASSARSDVSRVLQSITDALPFAFDQSSRTDLIQVLLTDLRACSLSGGASTGRLTSKDAAQALLALKTLGKTPTGSEVLGTSDNLAILLTLSTAFNDDPGASSEALRCIANALLLVEHARVTLIEKGVGGGEFCVTLLLRSATPDQIFLASRILFLCTASTGPYIQYLVENRHGNSGSIVEIIGAKLDLLTIGILSGTKLAREAMTDLLKLTFNILLHYPKMVDCEPQNLKGKGRESPPLAEDGRKVLGDYWSPKLDGILPPLLRVFNSLPPTFPGPLASPLAHVIHSLITIPITPSLHPIWFGHLPASENLSAASNNSKPQRSGSPSNSGSDTLPQTPNAFPATKPTTFDRALSVINAGRRSLSRSSSPHPSQTPDILLRAHDLLEVSFSHYLPGAVDPDDPEIREQCKKEGIDNSLDDVLSPLVVLMTRLSIADEPSRVRVREWIVPTDLDRTGPLEARSDLLGRCLRLLGSVYHPRLKDAIGELLYAVCDSDASTLSALVGYGNVAGFLFNKGIMNAPAPNTNSTTSAPLTTASGVPINPITGTTVEKAELPDMTDEEKEREAEKLFVLFDRLEKTGALPPSQNPIRKAVEQGKLGPS